MPAFLALVALLSACGGSSGSDSQNTLNHNSTDLNQRVAFTSVSLSNYEAKSLQLSWSAPTTRVDGSSMTMSEIGGYEISYIDDSGTAGSISIDDPLITATTLDDLPPSNYQFYIFTFDQQNQISPASTALTVSLQSFLRN